MSFISKLFGGKKEDEGPTPSQAIQKLRETEDMLIKKQEFLEKKVETEIALARKNASTNKRIALQALKRKKRYEKQLQQIDGTLTTIELQRQTLEDASTSGQVLQTMKNAADALKKVHQSMDIDQVHDMMDDIAEQQDIASEISNAISNPVAFGQDIDEDELEKELEDLEQEELDKKMVDIPVKPTEDVLPAVPTGVPSKAKAKKVEDEDDMKELEAWAS